MKRAGEPEIKLDGLINKIKSEGIEEANKIVLFPNVSIGDAP